MATLRPPPMASRRSAARRAGTRARSATVAARPHRRGAEVVVVRHRVHRAHARHALEQLAHAAFVHAAGVGNVAHARGGLPGRSVQQRLQSAPQVGVAGAEFGAVRGQCSQLPWACRRPSANSSATRRSNTGRASAARVRRRSRSRSTPPCRVRVRARRLRLAARVRPAPATARGKATAARLRPRTRAQSSHRACACVASRLRLSAKRARASPAGWRASARASACRVVGLQRPQIGQVFGSALASAWAGRCRARIRLPGCAGQKCRAG